ncbi:AAA family ATPase [Akkermansia sp. N21169]|jgi:DNA helicase-2/ATP-dependent DNA helicase PcrA|uniref:UvrD-helicase domain-containing protein n=1 Tax=Akkermansia sp. N21169 TaxID=3040765 RepID=UPI00244F0113|nr:UvrD-helicase domain-containing protein [Akkermansia sp. N21169]MDH3069474.1 AAA family ATPase [Akkermansia sp. N21169]
MSAEIYTEEALNEAAEENEKIIQTLKTGKSFVVEAGAGAGKTTSLNYVIDWIQDHWWKKFHLRKQKVVCITYTNAAVNIILSRLKDCSFIEPMTIHSFAWRVIKQFQSTLLNFIKNGENIKLPEECKIEDILGINYDFGVKQIDDNGILHLHHNDVITLFSHMLEKAKFRRIFSSNYPLILIDEYQDSFSVLINKFIEYYIQYETGPQFGFFGDSWQTIYSNNGACGKIENEHLKIIEKHINFRSTQKIIDLLNKIRPELIQKPALKDSEGEVWVVHSNDYNGQRQSKGVWKDELPLEELSRRVENLRQYIISHWCQKDEKTKVLLLTHTLLAAQQGYEKLLTLMGDRLKQGDDPLLCFFQDVVEPVFEALEKKKLSILDNVLKNGVIRTKADKKIWHEWKEKLNKARAGSTFDMISIIETMNTLPIPAKVQEFIDLLKLPRDTNEETQKAHAIATIPYHEFLAAISFLRPDAFFSTEHGVKGEEYDYVIFVVGRGWTHYQFDKIMSQQPSEDPTYVRNRNLFYVCCSRPKKKLIIFVTVPLNGSFKSYLSNLVGSDRIVSYYEFLI